MCNAARRWARGVAFFRIEERSNAKRETRYREIKRKLVYRLWYRFADRLGTETLADSKNSNARAERETRAGTFLRPRAAIYPRQPNEGERERRRSSPRENLAGRKSFRAAEKRRPVGVKRR